MKELLEKMIKKGTINVLYVSTEKEHDTLVSTLTESGYDIYYDPSIIISSDNPQNKCVIDLYSYCGYCTLRSNYTSIGDDRIIIIEKLKENIFNSLVNSEISTNFNYMASLVVGIGFCMDTILFRFIKIRSNCIHKDLVYTKDQLLKLYDRVENRMRRYNYIKEFPELEDKPLDLNLEERVPQSTKIIHPVGDRNLLKTDIVEDECDDHNNVYEFSACNVCLNCGNIYNKNDTIKIKVPKNYPYHDLMINVKRKDNKVHCPNCKKSTSICCDPLIAEAVLELNKRGYKTFSACSGHKAMDGGFTPTYILFRDLTTGQKNNLLNQFSKYRGIFMFETIRLNGAGEVSGDYYKGDIFAIVMFGSNNPLYKYMTNDEIIKVTNKDLVRIIYSTDYNTIESNCNILNLSTANAPVYSEK